MSGQATKIAEWLLLPPGITIILILLTVRVWKKSLLMWCSLILLYAMSINVTANHLLWTLQRPDLFPPLTPAMIEAAGAEAIVILGHSRYSRAPEYGGADTLNSGGLVRVRYGARLHRQTGLPILAAGGAPGYKAMSEADLMQQVLAEEFATPVRWLEEKSRNTYENALFSSKILQEAGIKRILLVVHSRDVVRAIWAFKQVGTLEVTPAPTLFVRPVNRAGIMNWIPNPNALSRTAVVLHELVGIVWYRLRYGDDIPTIHGDSSFWDRFLIDEFFASTIQAK